MKESKPKESVERDRREKVLPLVLEILPGQASHGLIDIYEPGSYEGKSLRHLCDHTLSKQNWSIEDRQLIDDILRQLDGGIMLCRGQDIHNLALTYAEMEESESGEKYLYVPIRVIKPQEGGAAPAFGPEANL
jgi:hypothetical protein